MSQITSVHPLERAYQSMEMEHDRSSSTWLFGVLAAAAVGWFLWHNLGHDLIRYVKIRNM